MRVLSPIIAASLLVLAGCPDHEKNGSIEHMNEGIKAAQMGNYNNAVKNLKEAVRLYPDNHAAWASMGQVHGQNNKWDEAVEAFENAVKLKAKDPMYQMRLGIALYNVGKPSVAMTHLQQAVEIEPSLYRAHWYIGRVYYANDEPTRAAESWTRAAELNPYWGPPFVSLGKLYLAWDRVGEAIRVLEQGTQHVIDAKELTDVFYFLGLAYDAQKEWDKAVNAYSKAIDLRSDNLDARFQRGLAYMKKGDKTKAREDLQEYTKAGSGSSFNKQEANKALMTLIAE